MRGDVYTTEVRVVVSTASYSMYAHLMQLTRRPSAPASSATATDPLASEANSLRGASSNDGMGTGGSSGGGGDGSGGGGGGSSSSAATARPFSLVVHNARNQPHVQCERPFLAGASRALVDAPSPPPPQPPHIPSPPFPPPLVAFGDDLDVTSFVNVSAPAVAVLGSLLSTPTARAAVSTAAAVTVGLTLGLGVGASVAASVGAGAAGSAAAGAGGAAGGGAAAGLVPALFGAQRLSMYGGLSGTPPPAAEAGGAGGAGGPPSDWTLGRLGIGSSLVLAANGYSNGGAGIEEPNAILRRQRQLGAASSNTTLQLPAGPTSVAIAAEATLVDALCSALVIVTAVTAVHLLLLHVWSRLLNRRYYLATGRVPPFERWRAKGNLNRIHPAPEADLAPAASPAPAATPTRTLRPPKLSTRMSRPPELPPLRPEAYSAEAVAARLAEKAAHRQARARDEQARINQRIAAKAAEWAARQRNQGGQSNQPREGVEEEGRPAAPPAETGGEEDIGAGTAPSPPVPAEHVASPPPSPPEDGTAPAAAPLSAAAPATDSPPAATPPPPPAAAADSGPVAVPEDGEPQPHPQPQPPPPPPPEDEDEDVVLMELDEENPSPPPPPVGGLGASTPPPRIAWGSQWEATRGSTAKVTPKVNPAGTSPAEVLTLEDGGGDARFRPLPAVLAWPVPESICTLLCLPGVVGASSAVVGAWTGGLPVGTPFRLLALAGLYLSLLFLAYEGARLAVFSRARRATCWVPTREPADAAAVRDPLLGALARGGLLRPYARELGAYVAPAEDSAEPARTERLLELALTPPSRWRWGWWRPSRSTSRCAGDELLALQHWLGGSSGGTPVGMGFLYVLACLQAAIAACSGLLSTHPLGRTAAGGLLAPSALIALQLFGALWASFLVAAARDRLAGAALSLCFVLECLALCLLLLSSLLAEDSAAAAAQGDYQSLGTALSVAATAVPLLQAAVYVPLARALYDAFLALLSCLVRRPFSEDLLEVPQAASASGPSGCGDQDPKQAAASASAILPAKNDDEQEKEEAAKQAEAARAALAAEAEAEAEAKAAQLRAQAAAAQAEAEEAVREAIALREAKESAAAKVAARAAKMEEEIHLMTMQLVDLEMASTSAMEDHRQLKEKATAAEAEARAAADDLALRELRLRELVEGPAPSSERTLLTRTATQHIGERVSAGPSSTSSAAAGASAGASAGACASASA